MKIKKILPALLFTTLLVPSCGSNPSSSGSSSKKEEPITVQFWHTFGAKTQQAVEKAASDFSAIIKATEGVDVTIKLSYQGGYDEINTKISKGFAAGNVPTMAIAYPDHVADYIKAEGNESGKYVYNLNDYISHPTLGFGKQAYLGELSASDDFVEAFLDEGKHYVKEGTYSLPFMKSSEVLFYNTDLLISAFDVVYSQKKTKPEVIDWIKNVSWEDFMKFCEDTAAKLSDISNTLETVLFYDSDSNLIISKMFQEEIPYSSIGDDKKGIIGFENEPERGELNDYVTELKRLHDAKALTTKGCENKYGSDWFTSKKCIFTVGSSGGTGYNDPGTVFTPGVCKVPASNDNPLYVSQGPTLTFLKSPANSSEVNNQLMSYAWQFAKYITGASVNVYMCTYGSEGYLPVSYPAFEDAKFIEFRESGELYAKSYDVLIDEIQGNYLNTAIFPGSATLRDQMTGIVSQSLLGKKSVTDAITEGINTAKLAIA